MIPPSVKIQNGELPDNPGVYFYYDAEGSLMYVGKATSLRRRVASYFRAAGDGRGERIAELVAKIARIDYVETPTVIEALVLEANQIKAHLPPYNVLAKDDKSFQYLVITNDAFPRPLIMRQLDLERTGVNPFAKTSNGKYLAVFGPFTSGLALKRALELIRKTIPWSTCLPPSSPLLQKERDRVRSTPKACFDHQLGKCPGVCVGAISKVEYRKTIRNLILFFDGKKPAIIRQLRRDMAKAAATLDFERATKIRGQLFAIEHIRDVSLITREDAELPFAPIVPQGYYDLNGRIEAYDISNISGTSATGSMVVFVDGKPAKDLYRKFKIKTVKGSNDFAMMEEVMRRRLSRLGQKGWDAPVVMIIDGGEGQMSVVQKVMDELGVRACGERGRTIPMIGIAKGFDRKQDRLVYDKGDVELHRLATRGKEIFQKARDEAHRFAVSYHRVLRAKRSLRGIL